MARTLVIVTMGGNDIANITEGGGGAMPERTVEESWEQTRGFVRRMRSALDWLKSPGRFPNGVFVVFANMYEFTDGTANVSSCPASDVAGIDDWSDPSDLESMVIWANEQYMQMAVETDTDMVFMLEGFCGHGFERNNPDSPCYRGPGSEAYFDLTCVHPSPAGHRALASLFLSVITE
jgi:lysophospholipase L1-like esterase